MALVLNGSGSITGLSAGGLPDGSVTADDIASTLDLSGKTITNMNPSGIYLGGTGAANYLDDYEEGYYEPTATMTVSGSVTINPNNRTLAYTKIGRAVTIHGNIRFSSVSSPVGSLKLSLPFALASLTQTSEFASGSAFIYNATGTPYWKIAVTQLDSTPVLNILTYDSATYSGTPHTFDTSDEVGLSFTYFTN
jgi:hypothetical protein